MSKLVFCNNTVALNGHIYTHGTLRTLPALWSSGSAKQSVLSSCIVTWCEQRLRIGIHNGMGFSRAANVGSVLTPRTGAKAPCPTVQASYGHNSFPQVIKCEGAQRTLPSCKVLIVAVDSCLHNIVREPQVITYTGNDFM